MSLPPSLYGPWPPQSRALHHLRRAVPLVIGVGLGASLASVHFGPPRHLVDAPCPNRTAPPDRATPAGGSVGSVGSVEDRRFAAETDTDCAASPLDDPQAQGEAWKLAVHDSAHLGVAAEAFRDRYDRLPLGLEELRRTGYIRETFRDPWGGRWEIKAREDDGVSWCATGLDELRPGLAAPCFHSLPEVLPTLLQGGVVTESP